jgi:PAS domain S-box-containing protein
MDDAKPTYDELKHKLDRAEALIAVLRNNGRDTAGVTGTGPQKPSFPAEREVIEAFIESEENFRNSMEACPLGIRVITADGELFYANRAIMEICGYKTQEELNATPKQKLYTAESFAGHVARKAKRIKGEYVPSEYDISINRPDGQVRTLHVFRREITWGGKQQFMALYEDITERLKMENAIRFHGYLVENIPDAIMSCDNEDRLISWNKGAEKIYGWQAVEVIGKRIMEVVKPARETLSHDDFTKILGIKGFWKGQDGHHRKNGQEFPALISASLIKDKNGALLGTVVVIEDITERLKMEANLRLNTRLVQSISDAIISSDQNFVITSWNKAAEEMYGWSEKEVLGEKVIDFASPVYLDTTTEGIMIELKKNGYWKGEALHHRRNGQEFYVLIAVSLMKDEKGNELGAVTVFTDITSRINAEKALAESRQRFSGAFHYSPSMNLIVDRKSGCIIEVNDAFCRVSGYSREELIGKRWEDLHFWYDVEKLIFISRELSQNGAISNVEMPFRMKNGNIRHFNGNFTKLELENGPCIFASGIDITTRKYTEEALIASEKRYRDLLDNMMEACQIIGHDWRYIYINDATALQGHFKKEDFIGRKITEVMPGIEKFEIYSAFKKCMEQRVPVRMEFETDMGGGRHGWIDISIQPIPEGIFTLALDITERKQAEIAIHQSEERFRRIFQSGPLGIVLSQMNLSFTMANARFCEIYGYSEEELLNKTFRDLSVPEDIDEDPAVVEKLCNGSMPFFNIEKRNKKKNGDVIWCNITVTVIRDNAGNPQGFLSMVQDVTARKEGEERINNLNLALRSIRNINQLITREKTRDRLIQSVCDNLVTGSTISSAWIILFDNHLQPVTWAGANLGSVLDELVASLKNGEMPNCIRKALQQSRVIVTRDPQTQCPGCPVSSKNKGYGSMTARLETDGVIYGVIYGSVRRSVLVDDDEISLFSEVAADISFALHDIELSSSHELLLLEKLRTSKLESIGTLAGGIAHDFNNLLTGIMGNIGLAKAFLEPDSGAIEVLDEAEKAAVRSRELTQQLLTFARGGKPIKKLTNIAGVIKDSASFALRGSKARLELSLAPDLWLSEADEGQIGQVIHNLVINADEAMAQGGTLLVTTKNLTIDRPGPLPLPAGEYIQIDISDSGVGISPENLQKIFEPYFTTKQKGSGLGLTSAYSIIKSHGGYLMAESVLNRGSVFHIYLPASRKTVKGEKKVIAKKSAQAGGKVLVMDDDEIIRKMLKNMLTLAGYQAETTSDGAEALEKYQEAMEARTPFCAVIMDLTVPGGMGGKEAIARLLEIDPEAAVIVSSGYATDPIMSEFTKYGFSAVIAKPYSIKQLQETLADLTAKKKVPKGHKA